MDPAVTLQEIIEDACALVRLAANRQQRIEVSPEVAALFEGAAAPAADIPPAAAPAPAETNPAQAGGLEELRGLVAACTRCGLHETRKQTVFGVGNPQADLVFVGEAPGAEEDRQGIPFVGAAGQLLTDIIVKGMKMQRDDVYICNVLKCRPPDNRDPSPEEKHFCEPFLLRQLELIQPRVICALGKHAAHTLLRTEDSLARMRGKWHTYHGIPLRVTYHPAYLLRNPDDKAKTWEDIKEVMAKLNEGKSRE